MKTWASLFAITFLVAACAPQTGGNGAPQPQPAPPGTGNTAPDTAEPAPTGGNAPPEAEKRFYDAYKTIGHAGLPSTDDRKKLQPFITPELNQLLKDAITADTARVSSARFKGDPFTANPAGATSIDLGSSCNWGGGYDGGICFPVLSNASETWKDQALVAEKPVWLVSDIVYGGNKPGDNQGRLTDLLKTIIGR